MMNTLRSPLLKVDNLTVRIDTPRGPVFPVRSFSVSIDQGELLGIVGESGSGKTMAGLSLLGLLPETARILEGSIRFDGQDMTDAKEKTWNAIRGSRISLVFQEPQSALNPILRIGTMFDEIFDSHRPDEARDHRVTVIRDLLLSVGLDRPDAIVRSYPHQLSGGMRQRVLIAMAIALSPDILIADEPTTALDPTMSTQILDLLLERNRRDNMALVLISHDLGIIRRSAKKILVLYAGRVVESASGKRFFSAGPAHPYSGALLLSRPGVRQKTKNDGPLDTIPGQVPPLWDLPKGCAFAPRCPRADSRCHTDSPPWIQTGPEEGALCFYPSLQENVA
ncbi:MULTISPECIES: ABC transporter ATP-binding protein [Leptospirillum]|jgi:oligopeptide/dipeptide ABC transporter ATP-binding protein|uniref:Peptide ABC transporter ATP-binding protein n=3 Tax=Leptospirillum ferriphilum TaxID=178606 RepID=A0A059XXB9_9BACT|nr:MULTISPECIES: ABC transporter ATP-binding protein [Leptospirillum]EAY57924.1 MAG: Oligopeptide/dipeptide ABC transporter, ATP-binding protein [Leptospirillum rubarum]EIJ77269.1 MAG: Oligopeptide/dipeptide ABC transporter, ATP-binding protein [Leptospirillum sp. Group II 'C75']MCL5259161.1 ABC transporter ATP-binding protein [Nitrospirota bacterium]AFS52368.1 ABC-type dipeptide/oligopeptide/nickel transport system, ATPase component [Leptospirillum ferriphilum ML-04]AIA29877.1 peptide ABC tra